MKDYKHLEVWRSAHRLALAVYENSYAFPKGELYGLTDGKLKVKAADRMAAL